MKTQTFKIANISCGHCVATIQRELKELDGVIDVKGDPKTKKVTIEWDAPATVVQIEAKLSEIGYPA
ncbi:MAG: heavy-metal-associated domain-containing protein [Proteobacteria bacterium]|nr:heavy-metal-associated domain-containing protein [Pseudomonadota bacterium]MBU4470594.1 heavy-metal-associated domain-containing protein [Pseudomonadota bacterium]